MKKIDIKLKILFLIFVFGILSFISYDLNKYEAFYIPDFTVNIFFSKLVAEEHTLKYCNEYAVKYNAPVFGGRYFVRAKDDGCVTHAYFHGYIIILAIFRMINESLIYFVTPLLAVIALIFFYKISRLFFDEKTSLLGVIILSFSVPFFSFSVIYYNNLALFAFFLGALYFFFKLLQTNATRYYILFPIFLSIAIWARYPAVLFSIPLIIGFFSGGYRKKFYFLNRDEISIKDSNEAKLLISALVFLIMILPLFALNIDLYGHPLGLFFSQQTSFNQYTTEAVMHEYGIENKGISFYGFDIMFSNLKYFLKLNSIISIFSAIALVYFIINKQKRKEIFFSNTFWILTGIALFCCLFYLGVDWYDPIAYKFMILPSLGRYLLPVHAIMILLSSYIVISSLKCADPRAGKIVIAAVVIFISAFNLNITVNEVSGLNNMKLWVLAAEHKQNIILEAVPEKDAVIFTRYSDKYIFPKRTTVIYTAFPPETRIKQTSDLAEKLLNDGVPVYFINESGARYDIFTVDEYLSEFEKNNMSSKLANNESVYIYKVHLN